MKFKSIYLLAAAFGLGIFTSCSDDDDISVNPPESTETTVKEVKTTYSSIALENYKDALQDAKALRTAIQDFVDNPTEANRDAAMAAWKTSRESYGPSEAFRFANGPIDSGSTEQIESLLNSWPMDEAYVDYVQGNPDAGIINNPTDFPNISKSVIRDQNGNNGEENVSTGYHAIEFLLWGQDLTEPAADMPGQRPYTDFVDDGTAEHQDRRRQYLTACADLLVQDLQIIVDQWSGAYASKFEALSRNKTLRNIINSLAELSRSELAIERMQVALESQDQEDEHSCFSDNTNRDIRLNVQGIANIYKGNYNGVDGASIQDLIAEKDSELGTELDDLLADAQQEVNATYDPFDIAIANGASSEKGSQVQDAVQALVAFGDKLLEAKTVLGVQ